MYGFRFLGLRLRLLCSQRLQKPLVRNVHKIIGALIRLIVYSLIQGFQPQSPKLYNPPSKDKH